jgi:hypothetical protein
MARIAFGAGLFCALAGAILYGAAIGQERAKTKEKSAKETSAAVESAKGERPVKGKPKLTPRQITFVKKELIPAAQAGDAGDLLELLSPQVAKLTDAHREGMDALLAEQSAPSIGRLLTAARLQLFRAKAEKTGPELSLPETVLVLTDTRKQIDELLAAVKKASFMSDPLPKPATLLEYRDLLFEVHVQKNQLTNARELVEFGKTVALALPDNKAKIASDEQREILGTSFRTYDGRIGELDRDMDERSLELRIKRVDLAQEVLSTASGMKDKFFAAYAIAIDGELLLAGFKANKTGFTRPALKDPNLADELAQKIQRCKLLGGDLIDKSRNLFVGLHWWRRGRYGRGPEGMGLLKSAAATRSFEASIPLFMPAKSPVPSDPMKSGQQIPEYDRRHHYAWAWQDRQFQMTGRGSQSGPTTSQQVGSTSTSREDFY